MQAFPLIEALWASLDKERPSGDDPARVVSALHRFYTDFHRSYLQGRRNRWKTPLFNTTDPKLRDNLEHVLELTEDLSAPGAFAPDSPLLDDLRKLDPAIRKAVFDLSEEEKTFGIAPNESPKLMQFDYLFEGWSRGLLGLESVETFAEEFLRASTSTRKEIADAAGKAKARDKESEEEMAAIAQASEGVENLDQAVRSLLEHSGRGAAACRPYRDAMMESGKQLGLAFHRLEQCSPTSEPCPFCGGSLSLSGRCRSCGRRLPHLEEIEYVEGEEPASSPFMSQNLRKVDLALWEFDQDPDSEELWKAFQEAVRNFGKQVDAGRQQVQMLEASPDRPIDSSSRERLDEAELADISVIFVNAQRALATFAFQPFPPEGDLPVDWRDPLLSAEPRLQAIEMRWTAPEEEPLPELP